MRSIPSALATHLATGATTLATCWRVVRRDKQVFRFTDHDRPLTVDGETYVASSGYRRTALSSSATLAVNGLDVDGIIGSESITEASVRAGLWDYAEIRVFLVNWQDTTQGIIRLQRGWLGEVTVEDTGRYKAELRGLTQALSQRVGELYAPECRAELGDRRCRVPLEPPLVVRGLYYPAGAVVKVATGGSSAAVAVPFVNGDFESGSSPTGWTLTNAGTSAALTSLNSTTPQSGSRFFAFNINGAGAILRQDVALSSFLTLSKVDAGDYQIDLSAWRRNAGRDTSESARLRFMLLDGTGAVLATLYDSGFEVCAGAWFQRGIERTPIAPGARTLRVQMDASTVTENTNRSALDNVTGFVTDLAGVPATSAAYEDRIFVCTTAGVTDATQPAYNTTTDASTTDGTAAFQAKEAWTSYGEVATPVSLAQFTVAGGFLTQSRAVTGFYEGGYVVFESGANAGVAREVLSWDAGSRTVTLFQPVPFPIVAGDGFRIAPGCDRNVNTCKTRFNNFLNFRGEPLVPGVDEYMKVGGLF